MLLNQKGVVPSEPPVGNEEAQLAIILRLILVLMLAIFALLGGFLFLGGTSNAAVGLLIAISCIFSAFFTPQPYSVGGALDFIIVTLLLLLTAVAVRLITNNLYGNLARAQQEIVERMQVEAALQASEERYRIIAEQAQRRMAQLAMLHEVSHAVSTLRDLPSLLAVIFQQTQQCLPMDVFYVGLYDAKTNEISFPIVYDSGLHWEEPTGQVTEDSYVRMVIRANQGLLINRTAAELTLPSIPEDMIGDISKKSAAILVAPLSSGDSIFGIISVQSYTLNAYQEADLALLTGVAYQAAIAIENARLYSAVQQELIERQALIQQLEAQNAELERFTYTVSHDLKSPLVTIGGFLGFLQQDAATGDIERITADIRHISNAVNKMQRLLDELLKLSRIGRLINPPQWLPFATIVHDALELVHGDLEAKKISVTVADSLPLVCCDRMRMVEVMQNLLANAARFMGDQPHPQIRIGTREQAGAQVFFVQDNGIGIDARYQQKIFGLFETLDQASGGTGIGLALVKRIIEVHNGRIWVESAVGHGATFCFTLEVER